MPTNRTELRPAWVWLCDDCGHENFEVARMEENETQPRSIINIISPTRVRCQQCTTVNHVRSFYANAHGDSGDGSGETDGELPDSDS